VVSILLSYVSSAAALSDSFRLRIIKCIHALSNYRAYSTIGLLVSLATRSPTDLRINAILMIEEPRSLFLANPNVSEFVRSNRSSRDDNTRYYANSCSDRLQETTYRLSRDLEYLELPAVERAREEDKHMDHRRRTIDEIRSTEKTYVHSLVSLQTVRQSCVHTKSPRSSP